MVEIIRARRLVPARETAERLGISRRTVMRLVAEERSVWLERMAERRKQVEQLRRDGKSMPEIAAEMDMKLSAVKTMCHRIRAAGGLADVPLGMRPPPPPFKRNELGQFISHAEGDPVAELVSNELGKTKTPTAEKDD